jgi:NAD-specific glutamate dehydrogenase
MSLANEITQRKAQERADAARRVDPELEASRIRLIAENPMLREYYNAMSKEDMAEELALAKREHAEMVLCRNREVEQWVKENPEIIAKVAQRLKKTVPGNPSLSPGVISASAP